MWVGEQEGSCDRLGPLPHIETSDFGLLRPDPALLLRGGLASAMFSTRLLGKEGN